MNPPHKLYRPDVKMPEKACDKDDVFSVRIYLDAGELIRIGVGNASFKPDDKGVGGLILFLTKIIKTERF